MQQPYILVINAGSSSIKFAITDVESKQNIMTGMAEQIATEKASLSYTFEDKKQTINLTDTSYESIIEKIIAALQTNNLIDKIQAVGHRVVHGGEHFSASTLINDDVIKKIQDCAHLAPLHNPANIIGIEALQKALPDLPQAAVFDTAFHQSIPQRAFLYALPNELYKRFAVRRYGFHGTSHRYVTQITAEKLAIPIKDSAFISAHLGNGCSVTAVLNGESIDTSMGLTPLEGLVMGTRSGDVDPGLHQYLCDKMQCSLQELTTILNNKSGLLGISELDSDMRALTEAAAKGHKLAALAIEIFCYRLAKYIAAYSVPLKRIDALIFTGGIGENAAVIREKVLDLLGIFGFEIDQISNREHGKGCNGVITPAGSPIAIVVNTNEELMIAEDTAKLIQAKG